MTKEAETITEFYDCFARRDAEGMVALYSDDVVFHDPAFGELRGDRAKSMWRMLCEAGKDLEVTASDITGSNGSAKAHWEANYTFSTGRKVHNVVKAKFDLVDGVITAHRDDFSFAAWSRQAFGPAGMLGRLLGAATTFQLLSNRQLDAYMAKHKQR